MPISKTYVKSLVNRLCSLPGQKGQSDMFDSPDEAKKVIRNELGRALEKYAGSDEHGDRIVEVLMQRTFRPVASDIAAAALDMPVLAPTPTGCEICDGQPWITVQKLVYEYPHMHPDRRGKQYMADGSERCQCTKGQWFRMKDRENKAKREAGLPV